MDRQRRGLLGAAAISLVVPGVAQAAAVAQPLARPAAMTARVPKVLLLGAAAAGKRVVAVGERGIIVVSDDGAATWKQVPSPVSVTLTAVSFADPNVGCAVGHSGAVLRTPDGGETWSLVLDGGRAAAAALLEAEAALQTGAAGAQDFVAEARNLVNEGADKPLLDVHFVDARTVIAVGAYGLALVSADAGATWRSMMGRLGNTQAAHLYSVRSSANQVAIAGEQGFFATSRDGAAAFTRPVVPYKGSLFAQALGTDGKVFVAGLRGNALWSQDGGRSLSAIQLEQASSFNAAAFLTDGRMVLADQAGQLWLGAPERGEFRKLQRSAPLNSLLVTDEHLLGVGVGGPTRLPLARS